MDFTSLDSRYYLHTEKSKVLRYVNDLVDDFNGFTVVNTGGKPIAIGSITANFNNDNFFEEVEVGRLLVDRGYNHPFTGVWSPTSISYTEDSNNITSGIKPPDLTAYQDFATDSESVKTTGITIGCYKENRITIVFDASPIILNPLEYVSVDIVLDNTSLFNNLSFKVILKELDKTNLGG